MEITGRRSLLERMKAAAVLDTSVYEEVEADTSATGQAALVVGIVAVCAAIGGASAGGRGIIAGLIAAFLGWLLWSGVTYLIGDKILGGTATWGELLRTIGFAQSPGVLYLLGIVPFLGWLIRLVVGIWILVAGIIAIRQALDFSTGRAIGTAVLGWLSYILLAVLIGAVLGISPQVS
ncbi:MAG: YIP1 family protein [Longimicrobiales bacterium]